MSFPCGDFVDEALCGLNAAGRCDFARRGAGVAKKEPQEMPRANPEFGGKRID